MAESTRPEPADLAALRPRLVALVRRVAPGWLAVDAEDIAQAAILGVLERLRAERGNLEVSASYFLRAAHNAAVDEIRRRFRRRRREGGDVSTVETTPTNAPDPRRGALSIEIDRAIRACLAALEGSRKMAAALYLLGHSGAEAQRLSGWTRKRMEHLTYRGLADLRECLTRKGIEP